MHQGAASTSRWRPTPVSQPPMSPSITYHTSSERLPTFVASLFFLLPGVGAVIYGVLTWFGLSLIENPSNGLLLGITGTVWAGVGVAIFRFRRWITVDPDSGHVVQGTRTLFRHPSERYALDAFDHVEVFDQTAANQRYYVVALAWRPDQRPRRLSHQEHFWLTTLRTVPEARAEAARVTQAIGLPLVDRTQGDPVG